MKVILHGLRQPGPPCKVFTEQCTRCKTVAAAEETELRAAPRSWLGFVWYFECPICQQNVFVNRSVYTFAPTSASLSVGGVKRAREDDDDDESES